MASGKRSAVIYRDYLSEPAEQDTEIVLQHTIEDYDVWDFELTEEEMAQLTALDKNDRFADY